MILDADLWRPLIVLNLPFGHFSETESDLILELLVNGVVENFSYLLYQNVGLVNLLDAS